MRVSIPGPDSIETPAAGIGLVALPYDRDSVLRALEQQAQTPRPAAAEAALDTLFDRFRAPFAAYARADYDASRLRASRRQLKTELDSLPRNAPRYRELYERFTSESAALDSAEQRVADTRAALDRARREFVARSDSLRARVRLWEDSTYQGYDRIVRTIAQQRGAEPVADTTGPRGWARFRLGDGHWWIYARSWDATDPNAEWYWNVPVEGDTVLLNSRTGKQRPKY